MTHPKPRGTQRRRLGAAILGGAAIVALAAAPTFAHTAGTTGTSTNGSRMQMMLLLASWNDEGADAEQIASLQGELDATDAPEATSAPEATGTPEAKDTAEPTDPPKAARTAEPTETPEATDNEDHSGGQDQPGTDNQGQSGNQDQSGGQGGDHSGGHDGNGGTGSGGSNGG